MEEHQTPETAQGSLSRRELLKTLAASGSALAAAAFLPDEWASPVVQSGVLPAHAQATLCPTIFIKGVEPPVGTIELVNGGWKVYVNWSPSWPAMPVNIWVQWCGKTANVVNITYNGDAPPYYSAEVEFIPPETLCLTPIQIRVVITFSRQCVSQAITYWSDLIDQ